MTFTSARAFNRWIEPLLSSAFLTVLSSTSARLARSETEKPASSLISRKVAIIRQCSYLGESDARCYEPQRKGTPRENEDPIAVWKRNIRAFQADWHRKWPSHLVSFARCVPTPVEPETESSFCRNPFRSAQPHYSQNFCS